MRSTIKNATSYSTRNSLPYWLGDIEGLYTLRTVYASWLLRSRVNVVRPPFPTILAQPPFSNPQPDQDSLRHLSVSKTFLRVPKLIFLKVIEGELGQTSTYCSGRIILKGLQYPAMDSYDSVNAKQYISEIRVFQEDIHIRYKALKLVYINY